MTTTGYVALNERRKQLYGKLNAAGLFMSLVAPIDEEIDEIEQFLEGTETLDAVARRKAFETLFVRVFESQYARRIGTVNEVLLPLGRCISPAYIPNGIFSDLCRRCEAIAVALEADQDVSAEVDFVVKQIARNYFAPHIRAFMLVRAQRLPYLDLVSHYLEDASMAFYRRNYFACANALTTAIERLLLEHVGWRFGEPNMHHPDIRARIGSLVSQSGNPHMDIRFETYKSYVLQFLESYQTPSRLANLSVTRFNRAFIQHVNDDGSYYTYDDCVTAFQFFDLYVEFVSAQLGQQVYTFVPEDDDEMNHRAKHYWSIVIEDWLHGSSPSIERALLESNPRFQKEAGDSNFLSLFLPGLPRDGMIVAALKALEVNRLEQISPLVRHPLDERRLAHLAMIMAILTEGATNGAQEPTPVNSPCSSGGTSP